MPTSSDRNLLFGLLALKMNFLNREALLDGMGAWMDRKGDALGVVLQERGALSAAQRQAIEALLACHIGKHGDTTRGLTAVRVAAEVRRDLSRLADADVQQSVAALHTTPAADGPSPPSLPVAPPGASRYRSLRPLTRGGLGEVSVALDEELGREVALKEIRPEHADHADYRRRFVRGAEITGHLEHPGVVPVYGMGQSADGRPFYAMRLVRGETLHDAIARFHAADEGRRDAGERELSLRGLLTRFVAVCNAVAYAHSRGVIHRDIKPAHVMLGEYGETLIVDWGLAKVLDQPEEVTGAIAGLALTELGQTVGTPAFMPPEQARGEHDQEGPASDVWALGATLYCLLTGRPPYAGKDTATLAERGQFPAPRQVNARVPRPLEAVCAKAMAARPEGRYATARGLAADVEQWLADEPVGAYRDPISVRAGRWARRNRTLVTSGVVVLAGVVGLAIGLGAVRAEQAKTEEALAAETRQREQAEANLARAEKAEAEANLKHRPLLRLQRAMSLARAGEGDRAGAEADDLLAITRSPGALYDLARVYSLAAAGACDAQRPLPLRERDAEASGRAAVALLQHAAKAGWRTPTNAAHADKDGDLDFLRGRDDYQRWRATLPAAKGKAP